MEHFGRPIKLDEIRSSNNTGKNPVEGRTAPARATARSPAKRPISSALGTLE